MHTYSFEKLEVWQDSRKFIVKVYNTTSRFPVDERFGLIAQLRRAAVSIASGIAEGAGRKTSKDQSHFYRVAYSSLMEVLNQLLISSDLMYIAVDELQDMRED